MANPKAVMMPGLEQENDTVLAALRALADASRLKLLRALEDGGELWDRHLYERAGIEPMDGSYHVGVLRLAGIVQAHRRDGKRLCYDLTKYGRSVLEATRAMKRR